MNIDEVFLKDKDRSILRLDDRFQIFSRTSGPITTVVTTILEPNDFQKRKTAFIQIPNRHILIFS